MKQYVQYGSGPYCAPQTWLNYDASPTLVVQRTPVLGRVLKSRLNVIFPDNVRFGNIAKGLPNVPDNSCDGVYCSHVLEHLALSDFRKALQNTYRMMRPGGVFRLVVPDLEYYARQYITRLENGYNDASITFGRDTLLGQEDRPTSLKGYLESVFGVSHHRWMWDFASLSKELTATGFQQIRRCAFNDSPDEMFQLVEAPDRFENCLAIECVK
jgi:SAM-dependent methyltransferase